MTANRVSSGNPASNPQASVQKADWLASIGMLCGVKLCKPRDEGDDHMQVPALERSRLACPVILGSIGPPIQGGLKHFFAALDALSLLWR